MLNQILFYYFSLFLFPISTYKFESCCSNEIINNNTTTTRLLSCPLNFVIKLHSANFYTGNDCALSRCQKRLNKHYLSCNNHRTCSISIQCIRMDLSICPWLINTTNNYSQYLIIEYDCILHKIVEQEQKQIVLFSAKINIDESSSSYDFSNNSNLINEENEWKEYFLKKYFPGKKFNDDKTMIIETKYTVFNDIFRTIIILIIFALILIIFMIISLLIYKRIRLNRKRKLYNHENHQPFPSDEAYDNLKGTTIETASDSGTTTDV